MALFDETGAERLDGIGLNRHKGKLLFSLVSSLLMTALIPGCCNNFISARRGGQGSSFDGREGITGAGMGAVSLASAGAGCRVGGDIFACTAGSIAMERSLL